MLPILIQIAIPAGLRVSSGLRPEEKGSLLQQLVQALLSKQSELLTFNKERELRKLFPRVQEVLLLRLNIHDTPFSRITGRNLTEQLVQLLTTRKIHIVEYKRRFRKAVDVVESELVLDITSEILERQSLKSDPI